MRRKGGKEKRREDGGDGGEEEAAHWTGRGWAEQPQSRTSSLQEAPGGPKRPFGGGPRRPGALYTYGKPSKPTKKPNRPER